MKPNPKLIKVKDIPALQKPCISDQTRRQLQQLYLDLYEIQKFEPQGVAVYHDIPKFTEGYLYSLSDGDFNEREQINYSRVFIDHEGQIGYEILVDALKKVDMTYTDAERITIELLYIPISSCMLQTVLSVFDNFSAFIYTHIHEYSNVYGGVCGNGINTEDAQTRELNSASEINALVLPEGVVVLYR